jgi:hypothetical protein
MAARRFLRRQWIGIYALATLLGGACGTEPSPNIVGTWSLTSSHAGGSFACTIEAALTLVGSGTSVTGSLTEEQVTCTDAGQPIEIVPRSGELDGREISFTTQIRRDSGDCAFEVFQGRVTDPTMSGVVETRPVFCQGTFVQMQGTWEAQRR